LPAFCAVLPIFFCLLAFACAVLPIFFCRVGFLPVLFRLPFSVLFRICCSMYDELSPRRTIITLHRYFDSVLLLDSWFAPFRLLRLLSSVVLLFRVLPRHIWFSSARFPAR
jgi:hypothetical protein